MPRLATKLALACASLLVPLAALELVLHARGYDPRSAALEGRTRLVRPSASALRGYELVPGAHGSGWGTEVAVNARGFRGPEPAAPEAPGERWIALGDSVTFGNDLAFEDTWPAVLERELAARGRAVEVLNLGLGGYDTVQELATLEELGLSFHPARVVLGFCVNDLGLVSMSMESAFEEEDRANPLYLSRLAQWLAVYRSERASRRALHERNREEAYARAHADQCVPRAEWPAGEAQFAALCAALEQAPPAAHELASRRIPPRWYASEARVGRLVWAFRALADLAAREGFALDVLLIPYLEDDAHIEQGYALVAELARAHGFGVIDPRGAFDAAGRTALRIRAEDPVHPDAAGHRLLARAVADQALASGTPEKGDGRRTP